MIQASLSMAFPSHCESQFENLRCPHEDIKDCSPELALVNQIKNNDVLKTLT